MGRVKLAVGCVIFLLFASLPQGLASSPLSGASFLTGTAWVLKSLNRKPLRGVQITLDLRDGAFGGYSGCNRYGGAYQATAEEFTVASYQMTMVGCAHEALRQEAAYALSLSRATRYRASGNRLELVGSKGHTLLVFSKKLGLAEMPGLQTAVK